MLSPSRSLLNGVSVLSLRCFSAVVETQSFSSAARQLRLAPSSVSKHVTLIESAVGVALIHRTTRRVSVTDGGGRFYARCLAILAEIDRAADSVVAEKELSGHLRVTAPPSFVAGVLGSRLPCFLGAHPALSLDLIVSSATPDLIRGRIDVALMLSDAPPSKLTHHLVSTCSRILCASPGYVARSGAPAVPGDLAGHSGLSARFSERAEGWPVAIEGAWEVMQADTRLLSDNGELLRQACLGGAGIGCFYEFHVRDDLRAGRLVPVLEGFEVRPKNLYAVVPHRQIVRPAAKALIGFVHALCEERVTPSLAGG